VDLWAQEEFQPVLEFFKGIHQQSVNAIQDADLTEPAELVKTKITIIRERLRVCSLLYNLPVNIKEAKEQLEKNKIKQEAFVKSQESGGIN
jgi:hypothetical protein